jgi:hypothetical protein
MDYVIVLATATIVALYALIVHWCLPKTWYFEARPDLGGSEHR